jgi:hypothetical protein
MSMKNSSDTIRNRTRDLVACSAVPEPTEPLRAQPRVGTLRNITGNKIGVTGAVQPHYKFTSPLEHVLVLVLCRMIYFFIFSNHTSFLS